MKLKEVLFTAGIAFAAIYVANNVDAVGKYLKKA